MRRTTYAEALRETLHQLLESDQRTLLIGQGVKSPWYVGSTTTGLVDAFGEDRVIDTPVSENTVTGAGIGLCLAGLRPIIEHPRMDFLYLAMDQIVNHISTWQYMYGGQTPLPLVIWAIINRGGEQAAQHSQANQAMFAHVPGLKVVMPGTPYEVKGMLTAAVRDPNPVLFVDERWLYETEGEVPPELYETPLIGGAIRREGADVTVAATSYMVQASLEAAETLARDGIEAEVVDIRVLKPLDLGAVRDSVRKTGRLVVADAAWRTCGFASEVSASIAETCFTDLKAPIQRVTLPDTHAPAGGSLEKAYYIGPDDVVRAVKQIIR